MTYNRYNNGKIYLIINNIDDMVYIGSTCLPLRKRIYNHKEEQHSGRGPNRRLFVHAQKYGWAEFDIILIEGQVLWADFSSDEITLVVCQPIRFGTTG